MLAQELGLLWCWNPPVSAAEIMSSSQFVGANIPSSPWYLQDCLSPSQEQHHPCSFPLLVVPPRIPSDHVGISQFTAPTPSFPRPLPEGHLCLDDVERTM